MTIEEWFESRVAELHLVAQHLVADRDTMAAIRFLEVADSLQKIRDDLEDVAGLISDEGSMDPYLQPIE